MDSHALSWPLKLAWQGGIPLYGCQSWGDGVPHFGMARPLGVRYSRTLALPLRLGLWTPMFWRGPYSSGYGLLCYAVAPRVGVTASLASFGPSSSADGGPCLDHAPRVWMMDGALAWALRVGVWD